MWKRIFAVFLCAAGLCSVVGCSTIGSPESTSESSQLSPPTSIPEESENPSSESEESKLEQAEQLTACLVKKGLTVDARQTCEITDEVIWNFVNGSYSCRENFPYPVWPEINESQTTAYFPLSDLQQMVEQVFGVADWMPDVVKDHCDEDGTRLKLPLEIGLTSIYDFTDMRSTIQEDGTITVTLQLIDTPNFPGEKQYGEYVFTFNPMQDENRNFLRLTGFTQTTGTE